MTMWKEKMPTSNFIFESFSRFVSGKVDEKIWVGEGKKRKGFELKKNLFFLLFTFLDEIIRERGGRSRKKRVWLIRRRSSHDCDNQR